MYHHETYCHPRSDRLALTSPIIEGYNSLRRNYLKIILKNHTLSEALLLSKLRRAPVAQ